MEWIQQPMGEDSFGSDYGILFHMLMNLYGPPPGLDFDVNSNNQPWENDQNYTTFNGNQ